MFKLATIFALLVTARAVDFEIHNNAGGTVWIGILGNSGQDPLNNGGFVLDAGQVQTVTSPDTWGGRFWARTWCTDNTCLTGDCGNGVECAGNGGTPPVTLAEINLHADNGNDFYDISLVDGFNIQASIGPVDGTGDCKTADCSYDINSVCPTDLQLNTDQGVLGCKSDCLVYNTDQTCCRGAYGSRETCVPPPDSATLFKQYCPNAYSYAFDDPSSLLTCQAQKYIITFG